jgi:hypothetical protein
MSKKVGRIEPEDLWPEEWVDWFHLTPQERWRESEKLWQIYLSLGGSLDPEPDTQSPFYDPEAPCPRPFDGRPGVRIIRRSGV